MVRLVGFYTLFPPRHTGPRFCRLAIEMQLKLLHPLLYCLFRPVVMGGGGGGDPGHQIINDGMTGHANAEDKRLLGGPGACSPEKN